jgi:ATP-dependent DNA ligase
VASDIDVVVVGSYFGKGFRFLRKPWSILCACLDAEDNEQYLTLCKVNMGSTDTETANRFLGMTGFTTSSDDSGNNHASPEQNTTRNCWFREVDHGKSSPDFLSKQLHQAKSSGGSWLFDK